MSSAAEAAAALGASMAAELVDKLPASPEGTVDVLAQQVGALRGDAATPVVEQPTEAEAPAEEHETAAPYLPDYSPEVPDDLLEELDEPDFASEAATEVEEVEDEYLDEAAMDERQKRIAAEKRAKWLEERLNKSNKAKWEAEALKYFPLSKPRLKDIKADSRRSYLRQAKAAHEEIFPFVQPLLEELQKQSTEARQTGLEMGRKDAAKAWGQPTVGPGSAPVEAAAAQGELEAARKTGSAAKVVGALLRSAGVTNQ